MSYLIDTCCISELAKPDPDENVVQWFSDHNELDLYLSVITLENYEKELKNYILPKENVGLIIG